MPELPEVETTLRGIEPFVLGATLSNVVVRNSSLRWPIPVQSIEGLIGEKVARIERRAKYILIYTAKGIILLHLGMSGSLRVVNVGQESGKHDHLDLEFDSGKIVRLNDPRRFGCCLFLNEPAHEHRLLANLGPEPLSDEFDGEYLFSLSRGKSKAIKNFIMDNKIVVGVGNIYASESLYKAGIRPTRPAQKVSRARYLRLAEEIISVLSKAIRAGGTTLNDFTQSDGKPGYFAQELQVYGRSGQACNHCGSEIKSKVIGQRNTFYLSLIHI